LILDERFVAAIVRGRGVTVLSAWSHAGVVNACLAAQRKFSAMPVDLVLGRYHLSGKEMEMRIEPTIADLKDRIRPRVVAPGHCTGWRAKAALARAFAPGTYGPSGRRLVSCADGAGRVRTIRTRSRAAMHEAQLRIARSRSVRNAWTASSWNRRAPPIRRLCSFFLSQSR
jgi:hypothetical protein